jgi:murein DD-endopeptidase MepM/ murein hydrolase activator NlpD
MMTTHKLLFCWSIALATAACVRGSDHVRGDVPLVTGGQPFRTVDLALGEAQDVTLSDGSRTRILLRRMREIRNEVSSLVDRAEVELDIDGQPVTLQSSPYRIPITVGRLQIDCPVTKGWVETGGYGSALVKDARLRLWPAGSPWWTPGTLTYPLRQRWFASATQLGGEPTHADLGEIVGRKSGYHYPMDLGGCEGLTEVVAATEGQVVSLAGKVLGGHENAPPVKPRYDVAYIRDTNGWYYRYSHLKAFDPAIALGAHVTAGQKLGLLGKEGGSGGWSHLHFGIFAPQPSGLWGNEEGYAFLWEAYAREYHPKVVAVARPHRVVWAGGAVALDGSRSWGEGLRYDWTFSDGGKAAGAVVERRYHQPGSYSEILQITDGAGRVDYDFTSVFVIDRARAAALPPVLHLTYAPTLGIRPGDPVTFKARSGRASDGDEVWDFGDGSGPVRTRSGGWTDKLAPNGYAETVHRFARPGVFVVRVERMGGDNGKAIRHLKVVVEDAS